MEIQNFFTVAPCEGDIKWAKCIGVQKTKIDENSGNFTIFVQPDSAATLNTILCLLTLVHISSNEGHRQNKVAALPTQRIKHME